MYDINSFERDLAALIGKPSLLRPFVCDGSPLECKVFIVGLIQRLPLLPIFGNFGAQDMASKRLLGLKIIYVRDVNVH
jgi:hypothetical protein